MHEAPPCSSITGKSSASGISVRGQMPCPPYGWNASIELAAAQVIGVCAAALSSVQGIQYHWRPTKQVVPCCIIPSRAQLSSAQALPAENIIKDGASSSFRHQRGCRPTDLSRAAFYAAVRRPGCLLSAYCGCSLPRRKCPSLVALAGREVVRVEKKFAVHERYCQCS